MRSDVRCCSCSRPALHGREEAPEVRLERREDLVGVVLGAEPHLALAAAGLGHELGGLALREAHDLLLRRQLCRLLTCLVDQPLGLALGLAEHLLALLDDPARLLDLLGDGGPHLVEDLPDLLAVDAHLVGQRHRLGLVYQLVELVDEDEDVHVPLLGSCAFGEGTRDGRRHQLVERPAEGGDLLHAARRKKAVLGGRHQVHGLDFRRESLVQVTHLELPLVVRDGAEASHERDGSPLASVFDQQGREPCNDHVLEIGERLAQELDALRDA